MSGADRRESRCPSVALQRRRPSPPAPARAAARPRTSCCEGRGGLGGSRVCRRAPAAVAPSGSLCRQCPYSPNVHLPSPLGGARRHPALLERRLPGRLRGSGVIRPGVSCTASSGDVGGARRARLLGCGPGRGADAQLVAAASVRSRGTRWSGARPSLRLIHEDAARYRRRALGASTPPAACARAAPPLSRRREAAPAQFAISSTWRSMRLFRRCTTSTSWPAPSRSCFSASGFATDWFIFSLKGSQHLSTQLLEAAHVHGALARSRAPLRCAGPLRADGDARDGGAVHCLADGSRDGSPALAPSSLQPYLSAIISSHTPCFGANYPPPTKGPWLTAVRRGTAWSSCTCPASWSWASLRSCAPEAACRWRAARCGGPTRRSSCGRARSRVAASSWCCRLARLRHHRSLRRRCRSAAAASSAGACRARSARRAARAAACARCCRPAMRASCRRSSAARAARHPAAHLPGHRRHLQVHDKMRRRHAAAAGKCSYIWVCLFTSGADAQPARCVRRHGTAAQVAGLNCLNIFGTSVRARRASPLACLGHGVPTAPPGCCRSLPDGLVRRGGAAALGHQPAARADVPTLSPPTASWGAAPTGTRRTGVAGRAPPSPLSSLSATTRRTSWARGCTCAPAAPVAPAAPRPARRAR